MIDVDSLALEISPDAPCGDNLEYDADLIALDRLSLGKPEQQFGDTLVAAEEPDWHEIESAAVALLGRTKDLRVYVHLARAVLRTGGYEGFRDVLLLVRATIHRYWDDLYPHLDPDDDNDPTERVNLIASLCDSGAVLRPLREAPLVSSRALGRFGLRDLDIAAGEIPAPASMATPPTSATIDSAFLDAALEDLQATGTAITDAIEHVKAIEAAVTDQVGAANAASLAPLVDVLNEARRVMAARLGDRGVAADPGETADEDAPQAQPRAGAGPISGEIASREDVIRMIDKICAYYDRYEPSSPIPLLLQRARRFVPMKFLDILQDMTPDIAATAEVFRGPVSD